MSELICPHCQSKEFGDVDKVPKGVVAVMSCPDCAELVVRFRNRAIALNRELLNNGSKDERAAHLADVISDFIEDGFPNFEMLQSPQFSQEDNENDSVESQPIDERHEVQDLQPISDDELKQFIDFDLNGLDNVDYFRKNFE
jgi:hypothetical protein